MWIMFSWDSNCRDLVAQFLFLHVWGIQDKVLDLKLWQNNKIAYGHQNAPIIYHLTEFSMGEMWKIEEKKRCCSLHIANGDYRFCCSGWILIWAVENVPQQISKFHNMYMIYGAKLRLKFLRETCCKGQFSLQQPFLLASSPPQTSDFIPGWLIFTFQNGCH